MSRAVGLRSILDRINAWMHAWKYTLANLIVLGLIALTMFGFDPWMDACGGLHPPSPLSPVVSIPTHSNDVCLHEI